MNKAMQTASEINDHLDFLKAEIIKVFRKYELMEVMPTKNLLRSTEGRMIGRTQPMKSSMRWRIT